MTEFRNKLKEDSQEGQLGRIDSLESQMNQLDKAVQELNIGALAKVEKIEPTPLEIEI